MRRPKSVPLGAPRFLWVALLITGLCEWQAALAQRGESGNVEGTITFLGDVPKSTVPDDAGVRHDLLEVDNNTRGLRHVVVSLTRADGSPIPHPADPQARPAQRPVMDQLDYAFTPRVLAVQEGEPVTFTNSDPANHNVRTIAFNKTNEFNVFTGIDGKYQHRFRVELQHRPIKLGCDIHPWMRGWIFVFGHPYFGVTDKAGRFRITGVPRGEYQLHVVQPDIGHREQRKLSITANETSKVEVVVRADRARQP